MGLPSLSDYASALIVKPSSLGDIVHTLPALRALKATFAHLGMRWLAKPEWLPLLTGNRDLVEVIPYPQRQFKGLAGLLRARQWGRELAGLRREGPEVVLDFQGLLRSALISRARGSRPIVGLSDAREGARFFYDETVAVDALGHAVDRYLCMAQALGADISQPCFELPTGEALGRALPANFILLHPWSRGLGKSLDAGCLQVLCSALAPRPVVLVGMTDDPQRPVGDHLVDLANATTLGQLLGLMHLAAFTISVDSGPMHMAAAISDRTLGIHTWSDPRKVGPYNPAAWVWKAGHIGHRLDFSSEQCLSQSPVTPAGCEAIAAKVLGLLRA
jgi:heptosyltransferase I